MPLHPAVGEVLRLAVTAVEDNAATVRRTESLARYVTATSYSVLRSLTEATDSHGIAGYVHEALREVPETPDALRQEIRALRDHAALVHLRSLADLAYLETTLGGACIPWLIVKGPTLAEPVHGSAVYRSYGDLDALVPASRLRDALVALEDAGSTVSDRNWTLIEARMKGEVHVTLPSATRLDLHWHLFNEPTTRDRFPVPITGLFDRSTHVDISGRSIRTLSPADTTVYVAMHTMFSGGHRLIWLKDVERLLAQPDAVAADIAATARSWRAELVLLSALRRVELALGPCPLARPIRAQADSARTWGAVSTWAFRRSPAQLEDGRGSLGRIVSRAVGPSQARSFLELGRRSIRNFPGRLGARGEDPRENLPAEDPRSDRYPSGGQALRERYLAQVADLSS